MAYQVWWALVLGFAISAIVQAWVPRERIEAALGGGGPRPVAWATGLGAASSSCSYAAIAIAKSLFQKGASAASRAGLPVRLDQPRLGAGAGAVGADRLAVRARRVHRRHRDDRPDGGAAAAVRLAAARGAGARARAGGRRAATSTRRPALELAGASGSPRLAPGPTSRTTSAATGGCSGRRSRSASCSPASSACSATTSSTPSSSLTRRRRCETIENVIVGPMIAVLSFVCSIGNVPLAAVLWSGGISLRRRDGVHLRRPDRAADHRRSTASTTAGRSRCGSRR